MKASWSGNGGNCNVDGICAISVKTSENKIVSIIWGCEAPINGCLQNTDAIYAAEKLVPEQKVKLNVPDQFAKTRPNGEPVYYFCKDMSLTVENT